MKPRHYPLITLCAAAALTLAPLAIFYFVVSSGPTDDFPEQLMGPTGAPRPIESTPISQDVAGSLPPQAEFPQTPHEPASEEPSDSPQITATDSIAKQAAAKETKHVAPPPVQDSESTETPSFLSTFLGALSAPPAGTKAAAAVEEEIVTPQTPEVIPAVSAGPADRHDASLADRDTAAATAVDAPYEAPRQLAMMSDLRPARTYGADINSDAVGMDPPPADAPGVLEDRATAEDGSQGRTRRTTSSRDRSRGSARREASEQASEPPASPWPPAPADGAAIAYEQVLLQTLREDRPVNRVENVIARASGHGWPIALVRSDLPDDVWWVQQMAGAQGNAFAARINFGNADTFSGSRFHLVFVFLDTADEVRRFRIAKQFKELPEGIRRSREFTFVRR